jgi:hypothetical protein
MGESEIGKLREGIIDRHMRALLTELQEHGLDAIGVAGGIVMDSLTTKDVSEGAPCHVFFLAEHVATVEDAGEPLDASEFVRDVARAMTRAYTPRGSVQ